MPGYGDLFDKLAEAYARPSGAYRAATAALDVPNQALDGYLKGGEAANIIRKNQMGKKQIGDVLGQGINGLTIDEATALEKPATAYAALMKAQQERNQKGTQLFGMRGNKGLVFSPSDSSISEIPIPPGDSDQPIIPKAVGPTLSPYADPSGQPLAFNGRGLTPVPSKGGTPVVKSGNEQAISDAAIMQTQIPNIDKLYDSYATKSPTMARLQATSAGSVLDPVAKQAENSLKLAAFTFGGKQLTGQEKDVVFGAFFPSVTDNAQSLENKRTLLKDYFSGKVDLLQAANLLGPAGVPLRGMLQNKMNRPSNAPAAGGQTFASEQEAEASGYKGPAIINGKRAIIH